MTEPHVCALCGLALTHGDHILQTPEGPLRFCCNGCRQVYLLLSEAADTPDPSQFRNTDLYRECVSLGIIPATAEDLDRLAAGPAPDAPPETAGAHPEHIALTLAVEGMWCPACAWVIERALMRLPGVSAAECNFSTDRVRCRYHPGTSGPDDLIRTVRKLGYTAGLPGESRNRSSRRKSFVRFAISAFLTINIMMLSTALYAGFFTELGSDGIFYISVPLVILTAVVYGYGGQRIHRNAVSGLFSGAPGMETLVSLGATCAFLFSIFNMARGSIHLYFDTTAMLITLVLLGKFLEERAKAAVQKDLGAFFRLLPNKVRICSEEHPAGRYVPAAMLQAGDTFRVVEGETVVADGVLVDGSGDVDESSLTGEPVARRKRTGSRLISGSRMVAGDIRVRAQQVGDNATLQQMILIMQQALDQKTPMEGKTEKLLRWFVPCITGLAAATTLVLLWLGLGAEEAVIRGVTVLVIACPCALGVAIPLTRVAGVSIAARQGILIRQFSAFEQSEHIDTVAFDKTGTVTQGMWRLLRVIPARGFKENEILEFALSLEAVSHHPIADEVRRAARERGIVGSAVHGTRVCEDGVTGVVCGRTVRIGSLSFAGDAGMGENQREGAEHGREPASEVFIRVDGRFAGTLVFGDRIREDVPRLVGTLSDAGYGLLLLSGDAPRTAITVGRYIGIANAQGGLRPEEKAAVVRGLQENGRQVAMVGDGVNDAPAMVTADLAAAVYSGSALNDEMADVSLMRGEPGQLADFLSLAARVRQKIRQNLLLSFLYNLIGIPVAVSGLLSPLVAVTAMLLSSLSVIFNTLALMNKTHGRSPATEPSTGCDPHAR
jgi:heavy metal translocating P-type ATPase